MSIISPLNLHSSAYHGSTFYSKPTQEISPIFSPHCGLVWVHWRPSMNSLKEPLSRDEALQRFSPIRKLPAEVLSKILYFSRTRSSNVNLDQQTIRLSAVCRFWRQVVIELCYSMWTTIVIHPSRMEFARLCLERSGKRKIRVVVNSWYCKNPTLVINILAPHVSRVHFLRHAGAWLTGLVFSNLTTLHLVETMTHIALDIIKNAPSLVNCVLNNIAHPLYKDNSKDAVPSPCLRRLSFTFTTRLYQDLVETCVRFMSKLLSPSLKSFTFRARSLWYFPELRHTLSEAFEDFLSRSRCNLEHLDVDESLFNHESNAPLNSQLIRPSLKSLYLRDITADTRLVDFLTYVPGENQSLPSLERLEVWASCSEAFDSVDGKPEPFTAMVLSRRNSAEYSQDGAIHRVALFKKFCWHGVVPSDLKTDFNGMKEIVRQTALLETPFVLNHIERWG